MKKIILLVFVLCGLLQCKTTPAGTNLKDTERGSVESGGICSEQTLGQSDCEEGLRCRLKTFVIGAKGICVDQNEVGERGERCGVGLNVTCRNGLVCREHNAAGLGFCEGPGSVGCTTDVASMARSAKSCVETNHGIISTFKNGENADVLLCQIDQAFIESWTLYRITIGYTNLMKQNFFEPSESADHTDEVVFCLTTGGQPLTIKNETTQMTICQFSDCSAMAAPNFFRGPQHADNQRLVEIIK